ncbi:MAG: cytosine deaminase related metal-dependent hydrolase [uncultured archaeon A07HR60]|nr:MAG: cytosine deaminase related metal-dependent hydrolase [uncultured archaeon A07HR60]
MLVQGTVIVDHTTVIDDGAVVVEGNSIAAVGDSTALRRRYPDHDCRRYDLVAPGLVQAHVHSIQSPGRGRADGLELADWLGDRILPMEAALDPMATRAAATLGYLECLASGTTTVVDHPSTEHAETAFRAAADTGIRARLGKVLVDKDGLDGITESTDKALAESERLIRQYHNSQNGRIQYAVTPRFAVSCSEACLRRTRDLVDRYEGVRIHTHAAEEPATIETVREATDSRPIQWLHDVGLTGEDVVLAHCVHTSDAERELLAETGTHVCHCPSANMKLGAGTAPVGDYRDRGINVAVGSDGPPSNDTLDGFTELRQAALLQRVSRRDPTALSAREVFRMGTRGGARAAGFDSVGRLAEGWTADVVGLSTDSTRATPRGDPYAHLVFVARGTDVEFTMVDGDVRYDAGTHLGIDAAAVKHRVAQIAETLDVEG